MWKVYSAVVVVLSTGPTEVKKLEQDFLKELSLYKKRIPESAACGLRSSGGFPHGKFSFGMRSLPDWAMVWDAIAELDGRFSTAFPYIATWEPIAMTKDTDHFVGLNGHKDNKLVADAPEIFANQSIILLSPPPKGFCRVGAFSSRVAVTSHGGKAVGIASSLRTGGMMMASGPLCTRGLHHATKITFQLVWELVAVKRRGFGFTPNNPMSREIAMMFGGNALGR